MAIGYAQVNSPIGALHVYARGDVVCALSFGDEGANGHWLDRERASLARRYPGESIEEQRDPAGAVSALDEYFAGRLDALDRLRVEAGGTPFQASVWRALRTIPAGTTISYQELARRIGAADAVRAVGAANGANPIAIVIPCHRVIGANGKLVGYGGGLDRKRWLLEHERGCPPLFRH